MALRPAPPPPGPPTLTGLHELGPARETWRVRLARALRGVADRLDPPPEQSGEVVSFTALREEGEASLLDLNRPMVRPGRAPERPSYADALRAITARLGQLSGDAPR